MQQALRKAVRQALRKLIKKAARQALISWGYARGFMPLGEPAGPNLRGRGNKIIFTIPIPTLAGFNYSPVEAEACKADCIKL
jgi:hypothetical protein